MRFEDTPNVPEHFYRRNLPHFDPRDRPYFLTYRLHGSIPKIEIERLRTLHQSDRGGEEFFRAFDAILDANGPYHLQIPEIRTIVMDSLGYLNERDLYIYAYTVMPNHVHVVCNILDGTRPLHQIMQAHKRWTGRLANEHLLSRGKPVWKR
jgi:putative transposase